MADKSLRQILIEGYRPEEILQLPDEQLEAFVFTNEPLIFKVGTAQILGEFRVTPNRLILELAQIDGGGEGVLPSLAALAAAYATKRQLAQIEWIVHAINCATPNLKLRRMLERRGFVIEKIPKIGEAYHKLERV